MKIIMTSLNRAVPLIDKVCRFLANIVLAVIILSVSAGIVSRYIFDHAFPWTEEVCCTMLIYMCFLASTTGVIHKRLIVADFLISKAPEKTRKIVDFIGKIFALIFLVCVAVSAFLWLPKVSAFMDAFPMISKRIHYYPLAIFSIVMAFVYLVNILNDIFPGYDFMTELSKKEEKKLAGEEAREFEEAQRGVDEFLKNADNIDNIKPKGGNQT